MPTVGRTVSSDTLQAWQPFDDALGPGVRARNVSLSLAETTFVDARCLGWPLTIHPQVVPPTGGRLLVHSIRPGVTAIPGLLRFELSLLSIGEDETGAPNGFEPRTLERQIIKRRDGAAIRTENPAGGRPSDGDCQSLSPRALHTEVRNEHLPHA